MVSPSWPRVREASADTAVPAAVAVDVASAARRVTVVVTFAAMGVAGAAAAREVRTADAPVADVVGYDYCRGACPSACLAGLVHGLHLQPWFSRCLYGKRPARGLRRSSAFDLTETSPPEQAQLSGLTIQNLHALHTEESRLENRMSGYLIECV